MSSSTKRVKKASYTDQELQAAIEEVKNGEQKAYSAAKAHNIPLTTLKDKLKGSHPGKEGASTILTADVEKLMVGWIEDYARRGQPLSKAEILKAARKLSKLNPESAKTFGNQGISRSEMTD